MPLNECNPFNRPGQDVTGHATAAVTGKRCVAISGDREGGNIAVAHATAAGRIFGVAAFDAALDAKVPVIRGGIVPILAGAAIAAFEEVEVGVAGRVIPLAAGVAVGFAVTAAANDTDAQICLYQ